MEISLENFVSERSQKEAARLMGVTQSAVSQMLRSGRQVVVEVDGNGRFVEAREIRVIKGSDRAA